MRRADSRNIVIERLVATTSKEGVKGTDWANEGYYATVKGAALGMLNKPGEATTAKEMVQELKEKSAIIIEMVKGIDMNWREFEDKIERLEDKVAELASENAKLRKVKA